MNTRRRRKRQQLQATILMTGILLTACIIILFVLSGNTVFGSKDIEVSYLSVEVYAEDTLWDIANEFIDNEYYELDEYIEFIIEVNGLKSETIYPGQRLTVPVIEGPAVFAGK